MRQLLAGLAAVSVCIAIAVPVMGFGSLLDQATARYPVIDGSRLDSCVLCHTTATNPGPYNSYGEALDEAGFDFAAIEGDDSDGDGFSNLEEIQALTFPGDETDFPEDDDDDDDGDDGDGGEVPILGRGSLAQPADVTALAAATDNGRDEAMVVWIDNLVQTYEQVWLDGTVTNVFTDAVGVIVDAVGATTTSPARLDDVEDDGDVDPAGGIDVAFGRNRFLTGWTGMGGVMRRVARSQTGEPLGLAAAVADSSTDPAVDWDGDLGRFLVASTSTSGAVVDLHQLDRSGTVQGVVVPSQPLLDQALTLSRVDTALGFADGDGGAGRILLAGDQGAPVGVLLQGGSPSQVSQSWARGRAAELQAVAAFGDDAGMAAWRFGKRVWTAPLAADGSLAGGDSRLPGASAGAIGVAPQQDGTFLVVWTDPGAETLMGVTRNADGSGTSDPFQLQEAGEDVDPDVLAVVRLGDGVLVAYATTGDSAEIRTVVVGSE